MEKELTIKVRYIEGKDDITVTDSAGNMTVLKSLVVVGGDFLGQGFYAFSAGSSSDAGWALAKFWRFCRLSDRPEESHGVRIFNHMVMWIATFFGWKQETGQRVEPDEILKRWANENAAADEDFRKKLN